MEKERNERKEIGKVYFYFDQNIPELPSFVEVINNFISNETGESYVQLSPNFCISLQIGSAKKYDIYIFAKLISCLYSEQMISSSSAMNILFAAAKYNAPVKFACERREEYENPIGYPDPCGNKSFYVSIMEPEESANLSSFMQSLNTLLLLK